MTPTYGDFALVATDGLVARLIRWATGGWSNHGFIYIGGGKIVEANPAGVEVSELSKYDGMRVQWSHLTMSSSDRDRAVGAALGMVGIPYGFVDIVAILVKDNPVLGPVLSHRLNRGDRLICSQVIARALRVAGHRLSSEPDNFVRPADLEGFTA